MITQTIWVRLAERSRAICGNAMSSTVESMDPIKVPSPTTPNAVHLYCMLWNGRPRDPRAIDNRCGLRASVDRRPAAVQATVEPRADSCRSQFRWIIIGEPGPRPPYGCDEARAQEARLRGHATLAPATFAWGVGHPRHDPHDGDRGGARHGSPHPRGALHLLLEHHPGAGNIVGPGRAAGFGGAQRGRRRVHHDGLQLLQYDYPVGGRGAGA